MSGMSHEEAFSELAAVALDSASAEVADAVRAHASACPECGPELAAMEETVATLGELAPAARLNPGRGAGIRSRLIMRARNERESKSAPVPGPPDLARGVASLTGQAHRATPGGQRIVTDARRQAPATPLRPQVDITRPSRMMNWYAMAATVAFVLMTGQLMRVTRDRNEIQSQMTAAADTVQPKGDSMALALSEKEAMIQAMAGPDVKVVALMDKSAPQQLGRMFWNRATNDWMMVTYGLPAPKPGKTYQVWLVTDKAKISAGTFRPDSQGRTVMHANYVLDRNALRAVAITEEPDGGMPAPTGPMVVAGSA
jgi:hypothetical protein